MLAKHPLCSVQEWMTARWRTVGVMGRITKLYERKVSGEGCRLLYVEQKSHISLPYLGGRIKPMEWYSFAFCIQVKWRKMCRAEIISGLTFLKILVL